uniref:Retrotransposon gag domain-containing protein n=1 Tax=Phytophthora ramorum TaxID=164328 RepID=H3H3J4_PHYRM
MDRSEFPHLNDSQFESVRKMAGIFGMDALQSLAAATPAEQLERVSAFDTYEQGLIAHLRAAFLPANYEYRQRSRFLACKQGRRELHEYIQEMRELTASLVGNPLHEHIKVTVFMDGLRVGPARTQLFRVQASTLEEAIQIALQEEYSHRQARTPATAWLGGSTQGGPQSRVPFNGPVPMDLSLAEQHDIRCFGCGKLGHMKLEVPKVFMDLSVKFEDFNSTERFLVLDMDKYDLILGMPWLEKHEPWIDWRGKAIGASRPAATDRALDVESSEGNCNDSGTHRS